MNNLLIIGAGGHGKVIVESAVAMEKWGKIAFLDDGYETGSECNGYPVLGKLNSCYEFLDAYKDLFIALYGFGKAEEHKIKLSEARRHKEDQKTHLENVASGKGWTVPVPAT